jgi:dTDP-4-dehydrorhamnose 3,5-epimerase
MKAMPARMLPFTVTKKKLLGVFILEPRVFADDRGFFLESYNERTMAEIGITAHFVQDNHSSSIRNVVRGLHYQIKRPQAKLVRVVAGEILDVAVDLRRSSPTYGMSLVEPLSAENKRMLWIPGGFAHGFRVLSQTADVLYKATDFYDLESERTIAWNDPDLSIDWQLTSAPIVSPKDAQGISFEKAPKFD